MSLSNSQFTVCNNIRSDESIGLNIVYTETDKLQPYLEIKKQRYYLTSNNNSYAFCSTKQPLDQIKLPAVHIDPSFIDINPWRNVLEKNLTVQYKDKKLRYNNLELKNISDIFRVVYYDDELTHLISSIINNTQENDLNSSPSTLDNLRILGLKQLNKYFSWDVEKINQLALNHQISLKSSTSDSVCTFKKIDESYQATFECPENDDKFDLVIEGFKPFPIKVTHDTVQQIYCISPTTRSKGVGFRLVYEEN